VSCFASASTKTLLIIQRSAYVESQKLFSKYLKPCQEKCNNSLLFSIPKRNPSFDSRGSRTLFQCRSREVIVP
jgi:hypothetical protein